MSQGGPSGSRNEEESPQFMKFITSRDLSALTSAQKGFIVSLRSLDPDLQGEQLREMVAEMFPPASLFAQEICDLPPVWVELRNFLNLRGANLHQHSSRRVLLTLAHGLYPEAEDRDAAVQIANLIVAAGRKVRFNLQRQESILVETTQSGGGDSNSGQGGSRLAHDIAMRLKDADKKFSGGLDEFWMDFVDEYSQVARDYGLSPTQKLQYLHNLVTKDVKRFYLAEVETYARTFEQAVDMINKEYNSPVRQTRVKNYLNTLRVSQFVQNGLEVSLAPAKVYKLITKLSRQVPASHRGDSHRIEFLRNATVGYPWSSEPLSRVATHKLTFQMLYVELEAALQLDKEARLAIPRDNALSRSSSRNAEEHGVHYAGQGRYKYNPKKVHAPRRVVQRSSATPLDISGCFNCGDPSHMLKDCPKPLNAAKAAARKLEYYRKRDSKKHAVHVVLAELCGQLDISNEANDADEREEEQDDLDIFQAALRGEYDNESSDSPALVLPEPYTDINSDPNEIFVMKSTWDSPAGKEFQGACVDSGAQKTVIGEPQAKANCALLNTDVTTVVRGKKLLFTFGESKHRGMGNIPIRIPVCNNAFLSFTADVVDVEVPLLLGLDLLTNEKLILDFAEDQVHSKTDGWTLPLVRKRGHVYIEWSVSIFFTSAELRKIHRHFHHPHPGKLYAMMRRADPDTTSPGLLKDLERITAACEVCQREADAPHRFRVSLPHEDCVFNRTVCLDLMKLSSSTVLHIVDKDTKFSAACFLKGESAAETWNAFMRVWVSTYLGFPENIAVGQGPQFESLQWKSLVQAAGISEQSSGVESHNALGVGERYHSYLRRVFNKVLAEDINIQLDLALQLAVKAINDTAGPFGLVPTLLVFGVLSRIPLIPRDLPDHKRRMKVLAEARKEMSRITHKARLSTALRTNVPAAADSSFATGEEVLMYREKPTAKWIGPLVVRDVQGKMLALDNGDRLIRASIDKVKHITKRGNSISMENLPSTIPAVPSSATNEEAPNEAQQSLFEKGKVTDRTYNDELVDLLTGSHAGIDRTSDDGITDILEKIQQAERDKKLIEDALDNTPFPVAYIGVHITEVLSSGDPRRDEEEFRLAKLAEINGLKERKVWKVVPKSAVPTNSNVLGGRFVLSLKNVGAKDQKAKARYIAQGHKDKDKPFMVHEIATLRSSSIRLILSIAAIKGFRIFSHDVNQAYVQSKDRMTRRIFILPKKEDLDILVVSDEELLELLRPLYGTCDAGDYWGVTIHFHAEKDLGMTPTQSDPALYLKISDGQLEGVVGIYVDDNLHAGNKNFENITKKSLVKFDSKPRVYDNFDFFGAVIGTIRPGKFKMSQRRHAKRLLPAPQECSFEGFRKYRAALAWMANTRPELCCLINRAAQVTEETLSEGKIAEFNRAVNEAKQGEAHGLEYGPLDFSSLRLKMYADAAFATNDDLSSQLGFLILLTDKFGRAHVLDYSSKNSKRVVRSIMGGEVYAFSDGFDRSFLLKHDLQRMLGTQIPLDCLTDSKQLFDAVTRGQHTTEKRLMIDICAARQAYKNKEITQIGLVGSADNPADGLSKARSNSALQSLLQTGVDNCVVTQWVIRSEQDPEAENVGM